MNSLKSFDMFKTISPLTETHQTIKGAIISIIAIVIILTLIMRTLISYYTPIKQYDAVILQDKDNIIDLALSVYFPYVPCNLFSIDKSDYISKHIDVGNITRKRVLENKTIVKYEENNWNKKPIENLFIAIEKKEGCIVEGDIDIRKIKGEIRISFRNYSLLWNAVRREDEMFGRIIMKHKIYLMHFGEVINQRELSRYKLNESEGMKLDNFPNFLFSEDNDDIEYNYEYYLKLIPYHIHDIHYGLNRSYYQYWISYQRIERNLKKRDMPYISFHFEFSSISIKITYDFYHLGHLFTQLCAIIGGIFVFFNNLNKIGNLLL